MAPRRRCARWGTARLRVLHEDRAPERLVHRRGREGIAHALLLPEHLAGARIDRLQRARVGRRGIDDTVLIRRCAHHPGVARGRTPAQRAGGEIENVQVSVMAAGEHQSQPRGDGGPADRGTIADCLSAVMLFSSGWSRIARGALSWAHVRNGGLSPDWTRAGSPGGIASGPLHCRIGSARACSTLGLSVTCSSSSPLLQHRRRLSQYAQETPAHALRIAETARYRHLLHRDGAAFQRRTRRVHSKSLDGLRRSEARLCLEEAGEMPRTDAAQVSQLIDIEPVA